MLTPTQSRIVKELILDALANARSSENPILNRYGWYKEGEALLRLLDSTAEFSFIWAETQALFVEIISDYPQLGPQGVPHPAPEQPVEYWWQK